MASSDGRVTYSSLSKLEKENTHFGYDDINHHVESEAQTSRGVVSEQKSKVWFGIINI